MKSVAPESMTGFTSKDICSILRESNRCNVTELTLGSLHVRFAPSGSTRHVERDETESFLAPSNEMDEAPTVGPLEPASSVQKAVLQEFAEAQILIDDPSAYENQLIDDQLDLGGANG